MPTGKSRSRGFQYAGTFPGKQEIVFRRFADCGIDRYRRHLDQVSNWLELAATSALCSVDVVVDHDECDCDVCSQTDVSRFVRTTFLRSDSALADLQHLKHSGDCFC